MTSAASRGHDANGEAPKASVDCAVERLPYSTTTSSPSTLTDAALENLLLEQSTSWRTPNPRTVESILEIVGLLPNQIEHADHLLALICNEVGFRVSQNEQPKLEEYQQRFPTVARELEVQWEIDRFITSHETNSLMSDTVTEQQGGLPPPPQLSRRVENRFEIRNEIGRGANGIVYQAWDAQLKRTLALKRLRSGTDASREEIDRMRLEAEAIAQINSPYIVQVFDVGEFDGLPFLAMEYCVGGSLANRLNGQPMKPNIAAEMVACIAKGVSAAHECRIIHRDLKPANILLTTDSGWHPKVVDFGLAKFLDGDSDATATGNLMGTPAYMAPEQAFGDSKYAGPSADVYSIGAILYECLTGRPPFQADSLASILDQVRNNDPISIRRLEPKVPRDLETIAMVCLRKEPFKRYVDAKTLAEDLNRYTQGKPILARPEKVGESVLRAFRRFPLTSSLATLAVVLLVSVSIGSVFIAQRMNVLRIQADLARLETERESQLALKARNRAREVLDTMTSDFATSALREQSEVSIEQKKFLNSVLRYYDELSSESTKSEADELLVARAALRVGVIYERLGNFSEAKKNDQIAVDRLEKIVLSSQHPEKYYLQLGLAFNDLGHMQRQLGEHPSAEEAFLKGIQFVQKQLGENGVSLEGLEQLAWLQHNLAFAVGYQEKPEQKLFYLRESHETYKRIEKEFSVNERNDLKAALIEVSLGKEEMQLETALGHFRSARERIRKLLQSNPENGSYSVRLGWCLHNFADRLMLAGQMEEAETCVRESLAVLEPLCRRFPGDKVYQLDLAAAYSCDARRLMQLTANEEASEQSNKAARVLERLAQADPDSNVTKLQAGFAFQTDTYCCLSANQLDRAVASAKSAVRYWNDLYQQKKGISTNTNSNVVNCLRRFAPFASGLVADSEESYWKLTQELVQLQFSTSELQREETWSFGERMAGMLKRGANKEALLELEDWTNRREWDHHGWYNLACSYSRASDAFPEEDPKKSQCADKAMDLLHRATKSGWTDFAHASQDSDLKPLAARSDFQAWLISASAKN